MKIKEVKISNYKSLHNVNISGFNDINMFFGYNNSGKSNFLKLLELIFKSKGFRQEVTYTENRIRTSEMLEEEKTNFFEGEIYNVPFIFTNNRFDGEIEFSVRFSITVNKTPNIAKLKKDYLKGTTHNEIPFVIFGKIISIDKFDTAKIELTKVLLNKEPIFSLSSKEEKNYFEKLKGAHQLTKTNLDEILAIFNDSVLLIDCNRILQKESIKKDSLKYEGILTSQTFKNWLFELYLDANKYSSFLDYVKFLKNFDIPAGVDRDLIDNKESLPFSKGEIGFAEFRGELDLMLNNKIGRYPLSSYGTGVQQILFILAKIFSSKSKIILIEELELNLSPKYQAQLINTLRNLITSGKINQVFFTTHSRYFDFRNDFGLYHIKINDKGLTTISSVKPSTPIFKGYFKY